MEGWTKFTFPGRGTPIPISNGTTRILTVQIIMQATMKKAYSVFLEKIRPGMRM